MYLGRCANDELRGEGKDEVEERTGEGFSLHFLWGSTSDDIMRPDFHLGDLGLSVQSLHFWEDGLRCTLYAEYRYVRLSLVCLER
jgi:hypothetical protein